MAAPVDHTTQQGVVDAPPAQEKAMATTATTTNNNANGPIDNADIEDWKKRFNEVLAKPKEHIDSKSPATSQSWTNSLFGCFSPIDLCCMTWCLPCVTFGKTHHRIRKNGSMEGYEPINTSVRLFFFFFFSSLLLSLSLLLLVSYVSYVSSLPPSSRDLPTNPGQCLMFFASTCVALHWIPLSMQRADVRARYNLQGTCLVDLATACCCGCCDLVQQEKESEQREALLRADGAAAAQQYQSAEGMSYGAPAPAV